MYSWPPRKPERNWLEMFLLLFTMLGTWRVAFGISPLPLSLSQAPDPFGQSAALLLFLGAGAGFVGLCWRDRYAGLRLEQIGVLACALGALMYATAIGVVTHWAPSGAISVFITYGYGLGCASRFEQIRRYMSRRREYERTLREEEAAAARADNKAR